MRRQRHANLARTLTQSRAGIARTRIRAVSRRSFLLVFRTLPAPFLLSVSLPSVSLPRATTRVIDVPSTGQKGRQEEKRQSRNRPPWRHVLPLRSPAFLSPSPSPFPFATPSFQREEFCGDHLQFKYIDAHSRIPAPTSSYLLFLFLFCCLLPRLCARKIQCKFIHASSIRLVQGSPRAVSTSAQKYLFWYY